jgi:hypothetical protein
MAHFFILGFRFCSIFFKKEYAEQQHDFSKNAIRNAMDPPLTKGGRVSPWLLQM